MHCGIHLLVCLTSLRMLEKLEVFCFVFLVLLSGCLGSQMWHAESSTAACGLLSDCVARASECASSVVVANGLVALWHVGP